MTSPGGRPVARVTVRVLPDTSDFDEQLRRELADLPDAKIDVGFNLDREELRRELATLANEKVEIPVELDNRALQNELEKGLAEAQARPVEVPVGVDRNQFERAVADAAASVDPVDLDAVVNEDSVNRSLTGTRILPVSVPVHADTSPFRADLAQAVAEAELAGRNATLFKFDADKSALERKIAETLAELQQLRANGTEIELRARAEGIQSEIAKVEARLLTLKSKDWSIPVQMKIDEAQAELAALQAEMAGLNGETVRPEVQMRIAQAQADLAAFLVQMEALDGKRAKFVAEADIETLKADAEVAAWVRAQSLRHKVSIPIDIDAGRASIAGAGGVLNALLPDLSRTMSSVGTAVQGAFQRVGSAIASATAGIVGFIRAAGPAAQVVAQAAVAIAQAGVYATALTVAGAGITAAWGAVASAISVLPGLLVGAAAAAGVLALGFDGVKKAAQSIKPTIDQLSRSTSAIFEKGLTPVFKDLGAALKTLKPQIDGIANSFVSVAKGIAQTVTSVSGLGNIRTTANLVAISLKSMGTGINDIIAGFLQLGAQSSVWKLLSDSVNHFGETFRMSVTATVADGTFDRAVTGLSGTIQRLSDSFVQLTTNGLRLFAGAAPGVNSFLDSLNRFFGKFDWERLGGSVGKVFDGLGEALDKVDPATFDRIEIAFDRLAEVFQDPEFQDNLAKLIDRLPQLIGIFESLVRKIGEWLGPIGDFIDKVALFLKAWEAIWALFFGGSDKPKVQEGSFGFPELPTLPGLPDGGFDVDLNVNGDSVKNAIEDGIAAANKDVPLTFTLAAGGSMAAAITALVQTAVPALRDGLAGLNQMWVEAVANWDVVLQGGFLGLISTVQTQMPLLATEMLTGLNQLTATVTAALIALNTVWTTALANWNTVLLGAFVGMLATVQTQMPLIQQAFTNGWLAVQTAVTNALLLMQQAVTNGMLLIGQTVTQQMLLLQQTFANGWLLVQNAVTNAMLLVQQAVTNGMLLIQQTVTNGMLLVQQAFTNGWLLVQNAVANAMLLIQQSVTTGMAAVTTAVQTGMASVGTAIQTGWAQAETATRTAMANMQSAVQDGMAQMQIRVNTGIQQMITAIRGGGPEMAAAMRQNMLAVEQAVQSGMTQVHERVRTGIATAAQIITGLRGQFYNAGQALGQGLVDGLNSKLGAVQAAAQALAQAATAALQAAAQINSPSKLWRTQGGYMGEGLAIGIADSARDVAGAAARLASSAFGQLTDLADAAVRPFENLQISAPQLTGWSSEFSAEVNDLIAQAQRLQDAYSGIGASARIPSGITASVSVGAQGVSASVGPAQVQVSFGDVLVPDGQDTAAEIANRMRRTAQLGIFG